MTTWERCSQNNDCKCLFIYLLNLTVTDLMSVSMGNVDVSVRFYSVFFCLFVCLCFCFVFLNHSFSITWFWHRFKYIVNFAFGFFCRLHKIIEFSQYIFYNTHRFQRVGGQRCIKISFDAVAATETLHQTPAIWSGPDSWCKCHAGVSLWCVMQWIYFFIFGGQMPEGGEDLYKKYAPSSCYNTWSAGGSETILRHPNVTCGWRRKDMPPHQLILETDACCNKSESNILNKLTCAMLV